MTPEYPNDADGDALRRVASTGSDMGRPMVVDFPVMVATEQIARELSVALQARGFSTSIYKHEKEPEWDVICAIEMMLTYPEVVRIQRELTQWAAPFNGYCNSWGTFGNKRVPTRPEWRGAARSGMTSAATIQQSPAYLSFERRCG